jgi:uncharacterized protein (TIGR02466 family)
MKNNNLTIEQFYPTFIGVADNPEHDLIENILVKECLTISKKIKKGGTNWISNKTYTTLDTYNLLTNKKFDTLHSWIFEKIKQYSNSLKYKGNYKCLDAWFNIYKKYDFQEYHEHGLSTLSAVYFLKSDKKSSRIFFKFNDTTNVMDPVLDNSFALTSPLVNYNPIPGRLLIFRSTVKHCVERQEDNNIRISLAYNFNKI